MTHLILLLYLLSGFSGISSIIFLIGKYGRNTPFMKGYIRVHLIYTSMMLISLVILYLRVNVITWNWLMPLFISSILAGQGFLLYALAGFSFTLNSDDLSNKTRTFWKIFPSVYFVLAIAQIYIWFTPFTLVPVLIGVPLFIGLSIWFSLRNHKAGADAEKKQNLIWFIFLGFTIIVIIVELLLKTYRGFLGDYSLNIPLIFLAWNALSLHQFRREESKREINRATNSISDEAAARWQLSDREREIAEAVLRGCSNKEIASDLSISSSTVKNHIYNIYRKTGVQSRVELVNLLR